MTSLTPTKEPFKHINSGCELMSEAEIYNQGAEYLNGADMTPTLLELFGNQMVGAGALLS